MSGCDLVSIASISRFHLYSVADLLAAQGRLGFIYTGYTKRRFKMWCSHEHARVSYPTLGFGNALLSRYKAYVPASTYSDCLRYIHEQFSKRVRDAYAYEGSIVFSSSFCLEFLKEHGEKGKHFVVDHGSMHLMSEREVLEKESDAYGFRGYGNWMHNWMIERMDKEFYLAERVVVCSEMAKESLKRFGVKADKITVANPGVNTEYFRPMEELRRSEIAMNILYVGSVIPRKGLHYLAHAIQGLRSKNVNLTVVGPITDKSYQEYLSRICGDKLKFIGPVEQGCLREYYCTADLFVFPSLSDGWGMVVSQAMACGLPVLVCDGAGSSDLVQVGVNGWIAESGSIDSLQTCLEKALASKKYLRDMGFIARETVERRNTWRHHSEKYLEALDS